MWLDLPNVLFAHNFNVLFSPALDGYSSKLTFNVYTMAKVQQPAFTETACLMSVSAWVMSQLVYKWPHFVWTNKWTGWKESTHDWLVRLGMDLALQTARINVIWSLSVFYLELPAILWLPTTLNPAL